MVLALGIDIVHNPTWPDYINVPAALLLIDTVVRYTMQILRFDSSCTMSSYRIIMLSILTDGCQLTESDEPGFSVCYMA